VRAWTDYPIPEAGDAAYKPAPLRLVNVVSWDGHKYCEVEGTRELIKRCYLYKRRGRCGRVPRLSTRQLRKLPDMTIDAERAQTIEAKELTERFALAADSDDEQVAAEFPSIVDAVMASPGRLERILAEMDFASELILAQTLMRQGVCARLALSPGGAE
jgi:hypothetical protein